jgi:ketosteroid isomerase-like protein
MADTAWIYEVMAAIEAREGDRAAASFAEDAVLHAVPNDVWFSGRAEIAKMIFDQSQFSTDERIEIERAVTDGETFALQWRNTGTKNSNGKSFDHRGATVGQLRDGLITRWSDYYDPAVYDD